MIEAPIYVVTDAEFDGPQPGRHSMLSFASVAISPDGKIHGEFEAVLSQLDGAASDPETMAFWNAHPEAYAAATERPETPHSVMKRFTGWVRSLPGDAIFVAHPLALDGPWLDYYLMRFTQDRLIEGPWRPKRLFRSAPLCLMSFASGHLGWPIWKCDIGHYPPEWLGSHNHSHRAIDDARGYGQLLVTLMNIDD